MKEEKLKEILLKLRDKTILVIGDFFLDKYLKIDRNKDEISVETGFNAYQVVDKSMAPGAAGTITNNLKSLGVGNVIALGFVGDDGEGYDLVNGLKKTGVETKHLIKTKRRITPTYTKPVYIENSKLKEINRFDIKNFTPTPDIIEDKIIDKLLFLSKDADGVIALDQITENGCGVITEKVRKVLSGLMNGRKDLVVYADSRLHIGLFKNVFIKCNHTEAVKTIIPEITEDPDEKTIIKAGHILSNKTGKPVFITFGKHGQLVFNGDEFSRIPAIPVRGSIDICGAGDAATSGIFSALCCNSSISDAAFLGNIISSITIQQLGSTGTATPVQIMERYREVFK